MMRNENMHFSLAITVRIISLSHLKTDTKIMAQIIRRHMNAKLNSIYTAAPGLRYKILSLLSPSLIHR